MRVFLLYAVSAFFIFGCVSNKTHREQMGEKDQKIKSLDNSLENMKRAMAEMQAREVEQKKRLQEFTDLTQRFKKLIDAGTLSVRIVDGKMVVSLGTDVLFPSGSAKLSDKGMQTIQEVTAQLANIPDKKYQVEGHTDNVPIRTSAFPSNWELASGRALTVVKTMIQHNMPAARVSAASFGDTSPVTGNDSVAGKALNRRIEIVVVPDLSSLPGYEELQRYSEGQQQKAAEKTSEKSVEKSADKGEKPPQEKPAAKQPAPAKKN